MVNIKVFIWFVDIEESMEIGVDTGYLIELDGWAVNDGVEGVDYFMCEGKSYAIKTPDTEDDIIIFDDSDIIAGGKDEDSDSWIDQVYKP